MIAVIAASVQSALPRVEVSEEGGTVRVIATHISVEVSAVARGRRLEAAFDYDSTAYLLESLRGAAVFGAMAAGLGLFAWRDLSGLWFGTVGFLLGMVWVGYGNMFITHWSLTRALTRALREAAGQGTARGPANSPLQADDRR